MSIHCSLTIYNTGPRLQPLLAQVATTTTTTTTTYYYYYYYYYCHHHCLCLQPLLAQVAGQEVGEDCVERREQRLRPR